MQRTLAESFLASWQEDKEDALRQLAEVMDIVNNQLDIEVNIDSLADQNDNTTGIVSSGSEAPPSSPVFEDTDDMSSETSSIASREDDTFMSSDSDSAPPSPIFEGTSEVETSFTTSIEDDISTDSEMDVSLPNQTQEERDAEAYVSHAQCNLDIDPSLSLPLWRPSDIHFGAVGYYRKSTGDFCTLFNAASSAFMLPNRSSLPPVWTGSNRMVFHVMEHGHTGNCYSIPLTPGHKEAFLIAKSAIHGYVKDLDTPKAWLEAHIDTIVEAYGERFNLRKEDISMVVGSLNAAEYTFFVSHSHPMSNLFFTVAWDPNPGELWGRYDLSEPTCCDQDHPQPPVCFAENTAHAVSEDERKANPRKADPAFGPAVMLARLGFREGDEGATLL